MESVRILVVDDDPDIHALLASSMADTGWILDAAYDGTEALERLQPGAYNLVITDIGMPGLDGLKLLEKIQQRSPSTPVLVMTAQNTPENVVRAIRERAFSFFSKPFSPDAVVNMVQDALVVPIGDDDIEVLSARGNWITLLLRCKLEITDRLVQFFRELNVGLTPEEQENIAMAFRELLMNAIEHGGRLDPEQRVEVSYIRLSHAILYYVRDPGQGFSFDDLPHAAVSNIPPDAIGHMEVRQRMGMRAGGFGIFMTRNIADELIYNEKGNQALLVKYLPKTS